MVYLSLTGRHDKLEEDPLAVLQSYQQAIFNAIGSQEQGYTQYVVGESPRPIPAKLLSMQPGKVTHPPGTASDHKVIPFASSR